MPRTCRSAVPRAATAHRWSRSRWSKERRYSIGEVGVRGLPDEPELTARETLTLANGDRYRPASVAENVDRLEAGLRRAAYPRGGNRGRDSRRYGRGTGGRGDCGHARAALDPSRRRRPGRRRQQAVRRPVHRSHARCAARSGGHRRDAETPLRPRCLPERRYRRAAARHHGPVATNQRACRPAGRRHDYARRTAALSNPLWAGGQRRGCRAGRAGSTARRRGRSGKPERLRPQHERGALAAAAARSAGGPRHAWRRTGCSGCRFARRCSSSASASRSTRRARLHSRPTSTRSPPNRRTVSGASPRCATATASSGTTPSSGQTDPTMPSTSR